MSAIDSHSNLSLSAAATLSCIYEATAPKPGNVHPGHSFDDSTTYAHFVTSAVVVGPILGGTAAAGVGRTVLDAVKATRNAVDTNTNLGTLLLLAPLAAVPADVLLRDGVAAVLNELTAEDTRLVYEAIRHSAAGGLGEAGKADVFADAPPDVTLIEAMQLAADRDLVACQYANRFADVFAGPVEWISDGLQRGLPLSAAIIHAHVRQLAEHGDSLIARKCGPQVNAEARRRAADVIQTGRPGEKRYDQLLQALDQWLRADGHRRNPGTTADFIAAGLFVLLYEGRLNWKVW